MDVCSINWSGLLLNLGEALWLTAALGFEEGDPRHTKWRDAGAPSKKADLFAELHWDESGPAVAVRVKVSFRCTRVSWRRLKSLGDKTRRTYSSQCMDFHMLTNALRALRLPN